MNVSNLAALVGSQGLRAVVDDNNAIYVTSDQPNSEVRYRARFYFDPNTITMANNNAHYILCAAQLGSGLEEIDGDESQKRQPHLSDRQRAASKPDRRG